MKPKIPTTMSEQRDKQIKQIANELFPDDRDVDKYIGFIFGAMWADKNPEMEDNRDEE